MQHTQDKQFTNKKALLPFLKRMFGYAMNYKRWFYGFMFWITIVGMVDAAYPLVLLQMIDNYMTPQLEILQQGGVVDYQGIWLYIGLFILLGIIQAIGVLFFVRQAGRIREYIVYDLREAMFRKLQKLSFSFYDRSASGWLLSRLTSDVDRVAEVISWGLIDCLWGVTMVVFCLSAMFIYSWKLALIVLISIPLMLVASVKIRMLVLLYSRRARKINSEITASYNEHINGVMVNKSTAQESRVGNDFGKMSGSMRHVSYRASFYTAAYIPVVIMLGSVASALVVFFGGGMAIALPTGITVGVLAAAFDYSTRIFLPIVDISMFYARAQGSLSAGERIFSLIDEQNFIQEKENISDFDRIKGDIEFRDLSFYYEKENPVLEDFNLTIKAGQSIALVGATGEGKSTIANLICRFYEPTEGQLLIDGFDYKNKTLNSLRDQLGVVLQTPHLFSGTIRNNIIYGNHKATDNEIISVLKQTGGEEFIEMLDEKVGEEGKQLSLGQKQLISFARAVLADPRIFIMDEATSSIDTLTEARIQKGIERVLEGRTSIVIAHRLSTIRNCDRILVIKKGKVVEDGSHEVLMNERRKYFDLYTRQLRDEAVLAKV